MGAAASVETNGRASYEDAANAVSEAANRVDEELSNVNISTEVPAVIIPSIDIDARIESIGNSVGPEQRAAVLQMLTESKNIVPISHMGTALEEIEKILPTAEGAAIVVAVAGAVGAACNMAPEIISCIGGAVLSLGEHLPYLGVAAGAIGAILYTFRLSKDQDDNVKTVTTWLESVKDWLLLVAEKIATSSSTSTLPLFQALQDAMLNISTQMDERNRKWRITKMLSSTQFERDFNRTKTAILELKTALKDFLDEETQNRQEAQLGNIANTQLETNEKLSSIDDQLTQIREILKEQAYAQVKADEASKNNTLQVKDEEESIYLNIQRAAGATGDVHFQRFVAVFEAFFYNGENIPPEQKRALKIALGTEGSGSVSKANWMKFYRKWTASGLNMEIYLVNIAEANPTIYQKGFKMAKDALAARGIENMDDAKVALVRKAEQMKASMGGISLPFSKKQQQTDASAVAAKTSAAPKHE